MRHTALTLALIGLLLAGCTSTDSNRPYGQVRPPKPRMAAGSVTVRFYRAPEWDWTTAETMSGHSLRAQLAYDLGGDITPDDAQYVCVPHRVTDWAWHQINEARREGVPQIVDYLVATYAADPSTRQYQDYIAEAMDCDDYAEQYARIARLIIGLRYGIQGATPAIGVMHVEQVAEWAGVPAGGLHALCWEATTPTLTTVRDPQPGIRGPADAYPNKTIRLFGHATPPRQLPRRERLRQLEAILPPKQAA